MIKNKYVAFCLFVVVFLLVWNLLDLLYAVLIAGSGYQFSARLDLISPLACSMVGGYLLILRR